MHPIWVVLVPLAFMILIIILNSFGLSFDQPPTSPEQDLTKRFVSQRELFRNAETSAQAAVAKDTVSSWELGKLSRA